MNNSKIASDSLQPSEENPIKPQNTEEKLRQREQKLIYILSAIEVIQTTKEWSTLKTEIFDQLASTLTRQLQEEAKKETPDPLKLNRLAGQLKWAEKFADLDRLAQSFRSELTGLRKQLYEHGE